MESKKQQSISAFFNKKELARVYQVGVVPFRSANMKAVLRFRNKP